MASPYRIFIPLIQFILDIFTIVFLFCYFLKLQYDGTIKISLLLESHYKALLLFILSWYFISVKTGLYELSRSYFFKVLKKVFFQILFFSIIIFAVSGLKSKYLFSNNISVLFVIYLFIIVFLIHVSIIFYKNQKLSKAVFIDWNNNTINVVRYFSDVKKLINCGEFVDIPKRDNQYKYNFNELESFIKQNGIQILFFSLNGKLGKETEDAMIKLADKDFLVYIIPDSSYDFYRNLTLDYYGTTPIYSFKKHSNLWNKFFKRTFDIVLSFLFTIFILSWLIPLFSLIIKLTSKGPIFYTQERIGLNSKPFQIIKFRSMYINAEHSGPKLSSDYDPRITPIGKIMRKYRIDELPQFINVLKGDMSIVGPRPERKYFINKISKIDPSYNKLHTVKPGITSLGQVYFGYAETVEEMAQRLKYDLLYLQNDNFFFDLKIIYLTAIVVIQGKGK